MRALVGAAVLLLLVGVLGPVGATAASPSGDQAKAELWTAMGTQWSNDARYMREYYVAAILGAAHPDAADAAVATLMRNQADIGQVFATYYGKETGEKITSLLSAQTGIATEAVAAAKAGDKAALADADDRWQQSLGELAKVLNVANPEHFPYDKTLQLLDQNQTLLSTAVASFVNGDYPRSIADNEAYYQQVQALVGYFGNGIVAQFPDRFK
ncbi:hypothetical protein AB0B31_34735 [Catellatospora citrea]|uniref:hypothetical protein n=1 Tax=Catellatospora citrea TaxID=53366 RepID=UPI003408C153